MTIRLHIDQTTAALIRRQQRICISAVGLVDQITDWLVSRWLLSHTIVIPVVRGR